MRFMWWMCLLTVLLGVLGCGGGDSGATPTRGRISGVVSDLDGTRAVETATVSVEGLANTAQTDAAGRFTLEGVPAGMHTLIVRTSNARRARGVIVTVRPGQDTQVGEVVLTDAGQISGLVRAAASGAAIQHARVSATPLVAENTTAQAPQPVFLRQTNAQGSYVLDGLPVGQYLVTISALGYASVSLSVSVTAGATTVGDASLPTASTVGAGILTGHTGTPGAEGTAGTLQPLAGVLVRVVPVTLYLGTESQRPLPGQAYGHDGRPVALYPEESARPDSSREWYAYSDDAGAFTIPGIPAGTYQAVAVRPGFVPAQQTVTIVADGTATAQFTLVPHRPQVGVVRGTVLDAAGRPIGGAVVRAFFALEPSPVPQPMSGGGTAAGRPAEVPIADPESYTLMARTGADGTFALKVPATVTGLAVYAAGYERAVVAVAVVVGGEVTVAVTLTAETTQDVVLSGTVRQFVQLFAQGESRIPVAGATVIAVPQYPEVGPAVVFTAMSDKAGAYRLALRAGIYVVYAEYEGMRSPRMKVELTAPRTLDLLFGDGVNTEAAQ